MNNYKQLLYLGLDRISVITTTSTLDRGTNRYQQSSGSCSFCQIWIRILKMVGIRIYRHLNFFRPNYYKVCISEIVILWVTSLIYEREVIRAAKHSMHVSLISEIFLPFDQRATLVLFLFSAFRTIFFSHYFWYFLLLTIPA